MKRLLVFATTFVLFFVLLGVFLDHTRLFILGAIIFILTLAAYDFMQKKHSILRNFPAIGRLRFLFELIRPEIQQYFIATEEEERPFSREQRSIVYARAKKELDTIPFGTKHDITDEGYESALHSLKPTHISEIESRVRVGGADCQQPYHASRLNISAMSFGAISKNAVLALNKGAKYGNFAHNTGEGGLSPYHLAGGGDIIWQLGTANFGARTKDGKLDPDLFQKKSQHAQVKMIEIKISQGAKPSHGGILPAVKITPEIAEIRNIPLGEDCMSPPTNPEFDTPEELLQFVTKLRQLSGGKPIGFKLSIGKKEQFLGICKAMLKTNVLPDFITVDGAEGGTGAAPLEFTNRLGLTIDEALTFVHNSLVGCGLREKITVIASGKIITGFDMLCKIALGADILNSARGMMFAVGCIQSLQCNKNTCPTGVATQNPYLMRGLDVESKYMRVANFHDATIKSFLEIAGAMGFKHIDNISPWDVFRRGQNDQNRSLAEIYPQLKHKAFIEDIENLPKDFAYHWTQASAEHF
ncbi:MAG: FMN-binding glutamate synthase family protein [Legionellales bacterium]|nr:FMN-binding glutamate synthase family protein [Legionellales bacterium]